MLRICVSILIAFLTVVPTANCQKSAERPHIVFVLADDLGPGDLGCYGGTAAATPNLDQLAQNGIRFTNYYSASPICSPSRCGLITGQFPARWKITSYLQTRAGNAGCQMADYLDPKVPSLPRLLKDAGYKTAHIGKWHLGGGRDVTDAPKFSAYGYDEHAGTWESPEPHPDITATKWIWSDKDKVKRWERTAFFVDKTLDFLGRHRDHPCFVNVWLDDPHTPWVPRAEAGKGASTAPNLKAVMEENDRQIGRLIAGLKSLGIENNTLVIFASDNGPLPTLQGKRSGGLRGCKLSLYEGGIRLPFIAAWPGHIPAGTVDDQTILGAVDVLPTLCRIAGVELPSAIKSDGEDRSSALFGKSQTQRNKPLLWEYGRNEQFFQYPSDKMARSPGLAIRDGKWKLLVNADGNAAELYDLSTDRAESTNLAAKNTDVTARLTALVLDWKRTWP
jgi:arylsulfatase A-like enzyme